MNDSDFLGPLDSWLFLCLPFCASLFLCIREYGLSGMLGEFRGWGHLKVVPALLFIGHLSLLFKFGESWFCGSCWSKATPTAFLIPGLGYSFAAFPALFAGSVFRSAREQFIETLVALTGWVLMLYGVIGIIGIRSFFS